MSFAARFRSLRKEKGLTQSQAAELCGTNPQSWSQWERGRCRPDVQSLRNIGNGLGLSYRDMGWLILARV